MIKFSTAPILSSAASADLLVMGLFEDELALDKKFRETAGPDFELLNKIIIRRDFKGKLKETLPLFFDSPRLPKRLILLGLGKKQDYTLENSRQAIAEIAPLLHKFQIESLAILPALKLPKDARSIEEAIAAVTEGVLLSSYQFLEYKQPEPQAGAAKITNIQFVLNRTADRTKTLQGALRGQILANATNYARSLANHPGNMMTPQTLAEEAKKLGREFKLRCQILEKADMKKLGMNALLAVNQGSDLPPKFIVLEYLGKKISASRQARADHPIVLIGKGITFDSGGISLKPGKGMDEMKFDMCGAATVLGAMRACAELKLPIHLIGLVPATENLPSGSAVKPGDIVRAMSGKTIEVLNTDAEGRMILADALAYAARFKPKLVIDFATLTGACVVALGTEFAGAFATDRKLFAELEAAAEKSGDKIWPLPLAAEYKEDIKSAVADIKNIGTEGKGAGTITAALFLQEFVSYPWIHLDIAGTAWTTGGKTYHPKGATGYGVRLMMEFLG